MRSKKYMVGNWKMNQCLGDIESFVVGLDIDSISCHAWVAPQALHLPLLLNMGLGVGGQNCSEYEFGAHTGEISSISLKDLGASFVIIGHSERRAIYKESDERLNKKVHQAMAQGLQVIFCVGETLEERDKGMTQAVIARQLREGLKGLTMTENKSLIVAYEPVWAIGTGKTATPEMAQEVHAYIREIFVKELELPSLDIPILYGGSVKPANAEALLAQPDIDGGLVGGASLKSEDFMALCHAASKA